MKRITSTKLAEVRLYSELREYLARIREPVEQDVTSIEKGMAVLRKLRKDSYEDLNQIQHESLILQALRWLKSSLPEETISDWYWNPRQTGNSAEPDLRGEKDGEIIVSAEATASEEPTGVIDSRMRDTLAKLDIMPGKHYFFVRTEPMAQRAKTKFLNKGYSIAVVKM